MALVDISPELDPSFKYRKGMTAWKVFHRGKGARDPPVWYSDWRTVPDYKRYREGGKDGTKEIGKLVSSMFHNIYTVRNNSAKPASKDKPINPKSAESTAADGQKKMEDPLNLSRCIRLVPHDDNQGGFFCAVFEKTADWGSSGIVYDQSADGFSVYNNDKVRQKPIMEELDEFAKWFEAEQKKQWEAKNVPQAERIDIGLSKIVEETKANRNAAASDVKRSDLSEAFEKQSEQKELQGFPYLNINKNKPDLWEKLASFYEIDETFPFECLYAQQEGNQKRIVMLSDGLHMMMQTCKKKTKLKVVNLGLKLFERNRSDKLDTASYRLVQEGLEILLPYMDGSPRLFRVN